MTNVSTKARPVSTVLGGSGFGHWPGRLVLSGVNSATLDVAQQIGAVRRTARGVEPRDPLRFDFAIVHVDRARP